MKNLLLSTFQIKSICLFSAIEKDWGVGKGYMRFYVLQF